MHKAAEKNSIAAADLLIRSGANVNVECRVSSLIPTCDTVYQRRLHKYDYYLKRHS